ncbi:hypothetical protein CsSME_00031200 [Camellia sinensis var. sinensis]
MGIVFTRLFSSLFGNKLVLGLDNVGKTIILYRLQMGEIVSTIPSCYSFLCHIFLFWNLWINFCVYIFDATIGFNVEIVQYNNIKFQVWDLVMPTY